MRTRSLPTGYRMARVSHVHMLKMELHSLSHSCSPTPASLTDTTMEASEGHPSEQTSSDCSPVVCLVDCLCQAPKAAVNRRHKVAQNLCHDGKWNKAPRWMSDPKSISVSQQVHEYSEECFVVSANKLFCTACREEVSIKVAVQACDHEITTYFKAYLIQTRSTDGNKLYVK